MRKNIHLFIVIPFLLMGCCCKGQSQSGQQPMIQPDSAEASKLSLTSEDIAILHQYTPMIISKLEIRKAMSLEDIIRMHELGLTEDSLILIVEHTRTQFNLTTSDVIRLQMEGIPFKVINHLIKT